MTPAEVWVMMEADDRPVCDWITGGMPAVVTPHPRSVQIWVQRMAAEAAGGEA